MKKILSSVARWAGLAVLAAALAPVSLKAVLTPDNLFVTEYRTYSSGEPIYFLMKINFEDESDKFDDETVPDDFCLRFLLSDGSARMAKYEGPMELADEYYLQFSYEIMDSDYSVGLFCVPGGQFAGSVSKIKNRANKSVGPLMNLWRPYSAGGDMNPLEAQFDNLNLKINPSNATAFKINFIDEYGEKVQNTQAFQLKEGQAGIQYVINVGSKPVDPIEVIIDWGAENVFCEGRVITNYVTEAEQTFTISQILDDGAVPGSTARHTYTVRAIAEGRADATMIAMVENENPVITAFYASEIFGTNNVLAVGQVIEATVQIEDVAGQYDEVSEDKPLDVTWKFGSQAPSEVETVWKGSYWESTAKGTIIKSGITTISVTAYDKDRGVCSTNDLVYAEQGPLLMATVADTVKDGMSNLGDGTISILQPGSGTIVWDPMGNYLSGTKAVIAANPFSAAEDPNGYDSFYYKWFSGEDVGKEKNDPTIGLVNGADPISKQATVNLLADSSAPAADRAYLDREVQYYFSRELYRPDNFGDIDGDGLGDEWEIRWFTQSAKNFVDEDTGIPVKPAESGAPSRADAATLVYDFSGTGNMDGDGLPANCFANMDYTVESDIMNADGSVLIPAGTYTVQTVVYPLPANSISSFGYLPLGGTHMVSYEEEQDVLAFRSNIYVNQNALNHILVDFSNELEFRGAGLFYQVNDGVETIDFRPYGDGDEPKTDPMVSDTDSDGMPDGWEYYFWAVAYYNVGSDQWLAFNGAAPVGGSYLGTGTPISREDILNTFNPTSAAFVDEDLDNDGLTNLEEYALGTSPISWDTDGDGIPDGWEVEFGVQGGSGTTTTVDPETGATTTTVDNTVTIALNPLKKDGDFNDDGDFFAIDGTLRHYDVFLAYDFDPRVGWCDPTVRNVTYAGNTFRTEYPYTARYTALEEFNLAAWYVEHGYVGEITPENWAKYTTDPCKPDTDDDGIPDGWEAYVGLNPCSAADASQDQEVDMLHPNGDGLNNLQEFLCVMAAEQYPYIAENEAYMAQINGWSNKPWPTNPNYTIGYGYANGGDTDNDQVLDGFEKDPNCNPTCCDTDHDYLPDLWECYYGTDPLVRDAFMDYDGDGLQNWQEYMTGAVWAWQYDKWYNAFRGTTGPGYGEVDMFDFFVAPENVAEYQDGTAHTYGGFGRAPHAWDCASGASARQAGESGAGAPFFFLSAEVRMANVDPKLWNDSNAFNNYGVTGTGLGENRNKGVVLFATTDPWASDSDHDGMDDFYEAFHGLNPLYGGLMLSGDRDLVGLIDPVTMAPYPSEPWNLTTYPWLSGDPSADPDKDGLSSREECANFYVKGGTHHTDPSPYWLTDMSYERSFVNLYYQPGATFAITMPPYWYFGIDGGVANPNYAFSFECNEGYDSDNDNVGDRSELTTDELQAKADPLDFDNPRRRKAMYFNGIDAACRTRGAYTTEDESEFRTFTVEAWICPVNPAAGRVQTIIERAAIVPQDTAKGDVSGKRINFRLSITETGALRGEFHNYQGAHVTMETEAANTGLRAGVWSHVALSYSGMPSKSGFLTIYVDGVSKKAAASSLQAFNGYLQDYSIAYVSGANETTEEATFRATSCPIVLGASDDNPDGIINGYQTFSNGTPDSPGIEPELVDYFEGWMDEVRVWDGARSAEGIRSTMYSRFDRADVVANQSLTDKIAGNVVSLRHHYTFDSLPDTVPSVDRSADAYLFPSDIEPLPTGMAEVFTAPNDGSYPGIPWWNASAYVGYRYDTRHLPWIEDSIVHSPKTKLVDLPRVQVLTNETGKVVGYSEYVFQAEYPDARTRTVSRLPGVVQPAVLLPNTTDIYGNGYTTHAYGENLLYTIGTAGTTTTTVDPTTGETNTVTTAGDATAVVYNGYDAENEGVLSEGGSVYWYADLLPLGGAVADIDVALWDGQGVGYELVTVDTDGDGIPDYWETLYGYDPFDASDAWEDQDNDGLDNLAEYLAGTNPNAADSDGDGYSDYYDRDTDKSLTYGELYDDGDNMPAWWEAQYGLNPRAYDADGDLDGDGWSNYSEYLAGTDPAMSTSFPEPPLLATISYDGDATDGQVVIYAYSDANMNGKPDAVFVQAVQSKDAGILAVNSEYLGTVKEGVSTYSGKLAFANVVNEAAFTINFYDSESHRDEGLSFAAEPMTVASSYYCQDCGIRYTYSQMITSGPYYIACPHGHTDHLLAYYGYGSKLVNQNGDIGVVDYATGEWSIEISSEDAVGMAIVSDYSTMSGSAFPFEMRRKWTSVVGAGNAVSSGHLKEGKNRFFAFLDLNGDFLYTDGEPAGMALYQDIDVGAGAVEIDIPLTDFLTGFPRLSWDPVEGVDRYLVTVSTATGGSVLDRYVVYAPMTYLSEQAFVSKNGADLGAGKASELKWKVYAASEDYAYSASYVPKDADIIASGSITNSISDTSRKGLTIRQPSAGSVVSDASMVLEWTMDYRNEGVSVVIKNTDSNKTYINKVCCLPKRVGSLSDSYYYTIEPQKLLGGNTFVDLPDGNYSLTLTENINNSGVTKKSATVNFVVDHAGALESNAKADGLGSITGTVTYYGKIPFTVTDEVLGTFDGATTLLYAPIGHTPIPGSVSVKIVQGSDTVFTASDVGGRDGYPRQGLYSTYGSMVQSSSFVEYGSEDSGTGPMVSLELETAPAAGSQLVVTYKQYDCPIRIQAFAASVSGDTTFSAAPAAQTTAYNKGAFTLEGLPAGTYSLRAFLDQDGDYVLDAWESVGYAMSVVRQTIGINNFATFDVPPGANNVEIVMADKDTDSDLLPDAWEYYYYKGLTGQGGQTKSKVGVYLWQEYADGELDSNPLVEDTDGDGLPDVVEHMLGSDNHSFDSDGDGVGDLEEFLAGSDPCDAADVARFKAPAPTFLEDGTPAMVLETPALIPGLYIKYTLLGKNALGDKWSVVGVSEKIGVYKTEATGLARGTTTIVDEAAGDAAFYKVSVSFESDTILLQ